MIRWGRGRARTPRRSGKARSWHLARVAVSMLARYRRRVLVALAVLLGALGTMLAGPALVGYAINDGLVHHHSMRVVDLAGACYLVVAVASFFFARAQTRLLSSTGEFVLNDLRKSVFAHLLAQPLAFFDSESSGQLLSRMTADIDVLETLVQSGLGTFVTSIGLFFFSIIVLLVMSPLLLLAVIVCLVPVLVAASHYKTRSTAAYGAVRQRIGEALASLDESLAGVRVVQSFRLESKVTSEFEERNQAQLDSEMATVRLGAHFFPKVEWSGVVATVVVLGLGGWFIHLGLTSVGTVAAFVLYIANLFGSIQSLSQLFDLLQSSGAAFATVVALLESEPMMADPADPACLPSQGALELSSVSFAYGSGSDSDLLDATAGGADHEASEELSRQPALEGIDLAVDQGEHLVLVGPTGAGKSTLAKLMGRLYDPASGSVRFGGVDLRDATLAHVRERIVVVPQEGFLFRGTVLENVMIGRPEATEEDARAAIADLGLEERLAGLPEGLCTDVGERGSHLSAGERQLVSLARAALGEPAVIVLDEATSSVDPRTEILIEKALERLGEGRTTITVAHRLTTAERGDKVAVVDDGRVVEVGSHDELVERGGRYAGLYAAWCGAASAGEAPGPGAQEDPGEQVVPADGVAPGERAGMAGFATPVSVSA